MPPEIQEDRTPGAWGLLAVAHRQHGPGVVVHTASQAHVLFVVDAPAEAAVSVDGAPEAEVALLPDQLAYCPAGTPSRWAWQTDAATTYVALDDDRVRALVGATVELRPRYAFRDGLLRECIRALAELANEDDRLDPDYAAAALRLIAQHLARFHARSPSGPAETPTPLSPEDLAHIEGLARDELAGDLSLRRLAGACHLSPDHFGRRFRAATGETPHQYVTRLRIAKGRRLLRETRQPVEAVAGAVGYRSASHFARLFRQHVGLSPRAYRAAVR